MKLPSLALLFSQILATIKRFPFAIAAAVTATVFCIIQTHMLFNNRDTHHWYWNVIMSCYIAMLLQIAIAGYCERKLFTLRLKLTIQIIGLALAVGYYYTLPEKTMEISNIRFLLYVLGLHLMIAFIPFTSVDEMNGFWQYNKIIFLRIITTALYTGVLYMGLALALLAIEKLFSVKVNYKLYGDLWIVLTGIFNTCFFLAGFPSEYAKLEEEKDYPKGLQIFTQYVLLPILTIYLLILYAYTFKILFTLNWPVGWVSYLVLGFSVAGILSILLIHPIRNEVSNKWILTFSRFFYFAIFPLLILLFMAIERRVSDYGITELRYFVLLLALWLLFIAAYFLISKKKSIKVIPQSLCLLAFLCSFGPWGVFKVSQRSQRYHFVKLMEKNKLLVNGKAIKATEKIPMKDRKQISSIVSYLLETHGAKSLQPYFYQNIDSMMKHDSIYAYQQSKKLLELINMEYAYYYETDSVENKEINFRTVSNNTMADVSGYDYYIKDYRCYIHKDDINKEEYKFEKNNVIALYNFQANLLTIKMNNEKGFMIDLAERLNVINNNAGLMTNKLPDSLLTFKGIDDKYEYKLVLGYVTASKDNKTIQVNDISGEIFIAKRK